MLQKITEPQALYSKAPTPGESVHSSLTTPPKKKKLNWKIIGSILTVCLVAVVGVKAISFLQALGILVLSKILFGGFGGHSRWIGGQAWKEKMKQRWDKMTPDERDKFKAEWKNRCGGKWGRIDKKDDNAAMTN